MKYRTDLSKLCGGINEEAIAAVKSMYLSKISYIDTKDSLSVVFHDHKFTKVEIAEMKGFAFGLQYAGYGEN